MNRLTIIGNLTRDPEKRTTQSGLTVCSFTVAVNRRQREPGENTADYFRVSAWRELGENCAKYLCKGKKVAVVGSVQVSTYKASDGNYRASMEVNAQEVEFLTKSESGTQGAAPTEQTEGQFIQVENEELPF